jgi:hypothetical protein
MDVREKKQVLKWIKTAICPQKEGKAIFSIEKPGGE